MTYTLNVGYHEVSEAFRRLHENILSGDAGAVACSFSAESRLLSSHLGEATGPETIASTLVSGYRGHDAWFNVTNSHVRISGDMAAQSAYLTGGLHTPAALFGGHYTLRWSQSEGGWRIDELRFVLDWVQAQGTPLEIPGWDLSARPELIVSELDAPWHVIPNSDSGRSVTDEVLSTYVRYAWGIDQQDIGLMASAFTADATADMVPFGKMESGREITGKLKLLRNGQPWMQHSMGRVSVQTLDEQAGAATLRIYRDVPAFDPTPVEVKDRFGAWYTATLRREAESWAFTSLVYHPHSVTMPPED